MLTTVQRLQENWPILSAELTEWQGTGNIHLCCQVFTVVTMEHVHDAVHLLLQG